MLNRTRHGIGVALITLVTGSAGAEAQDASPSARSGFAMAHDANRSTVVLFGGSDAEYERVADTWEFADGAWRQSPHEGPAARSEHVMVYDSHRQRIVLFGGIGEGGRKNDTWGYDGRSWRQLADQSPPPRRREQSTRGYTCPARDS